jgi:hypothetical protein
MDHDAPRGRNVVRLSQIVHSVARNLDKRKHSAIENFQIVVATVNVRKNRFRRNNSRRFDSVTTGDQSCLN